MYPFLFASFIDCIHLQYCRCVNNLVHIFLVVVVEITTATATTIIIIRRRGKGGNFGRNERKGKEGRKEGS